MVRTRGVKRKELIVYKLLRGPARSCGDRDIVEKHPESSACDQAWAMARGAVAATHCLIQELIHSALVVAQ